MIFFSRVLLDVLGFTMVETTVVDVCCVFFGGEAIGSVWKSSTDASISSGSASMTRSGSRSVGCDSGAVDDATRLSSAGGVGW